MSLRTTNCFCMTDWLVLDFVCFDFGSMGLDAAFIKPLSFFIILPSQLLPSLTEPLDRWIYIICRM